jgi:hypothetical protein
MGICEVTKDLIRGLICDAGSRLEIDQIKGHAFF